MAKRPSAKRQHRFDELIIWRLRAASEDQQVHQRVHRGAEQRFWRFVVVEQSGHHHARIFGTAHF
jgi:hypothetical protein